jgi:putative flippase GtrA
VARPDDAETSGFWLVDRVIESEFGLKVTKYAVGSVIALTTSVVVFALLLWAGVGTTVDSVAAFLAGAIPNWVLNRRWAWERSEHKVDVAREVVGYTIVSLVSLAAASGVTHWTHIWVDKNVKAGSGLRVIVVTGSYVLVQAVLFLAKFVVYDRWVFTGESRIRTAIRARLARRGAGREKPADEGLADGGGCDHCGGRTGEGGSVERQGAPLLPDAGHTGVEVQCRRPAE